MAEAVDQTQFVGPSVRVLVGDQPTIETGARIELSPAARPSERRWAAVCAVPTVAVLAFLALTVPGLWRGGADRVPPAPVTQIRSLDSGFKPTLVADRQAPRHHRPRPRVRRATARRVTARTRRSLRPPRGRPPARPIRSAPLKSAGPTRHAPVQGRRSTSPPAPEFF